MHTCSAPVRRSLCSEEQIPLGLHVLGLPLAFILSQDQTLHCMFVCPYTQIQFKIDALVFFLTWLLYLIVNELCSFRFLRTLNLSSCSWFASAKVKSFSESTKTFLKFFFVTSKIVLIYPTLLLRSLFSRIGTANVSAFLLTAKNFETYFWSFFFKPLNLFLILLTALLRCSSILICGCKSTPFFQPHKLFYDSFSSHYLSRWMIKELFYLKITGNSEIRKIK